MLLVHCRIVTSHPSSQLHVAAANGYTEVLEFLLSQDDVNLNIQDCEGWTPFHAAVCWGQQEAMRMLAEKGVNLDIKNLHGETAYGRQPSGWILSHSLGP